MSDLHICRRVIEWELDGQARREASIWLPTDRYGSSRGDDCTRDGYGENLPIWIYAADAEPVALEPGNRTAKPLTGRINFGQGVVFLSLADILILPRRKRSGGKRN